MPTLDWLNRQSAFTTSARVPYRLLAQVSVHASIALLAPSPVTGEGGGEGSPRTPTSPITQDNLLIQGDNLEHAQWLSMMLPRLQLLRELLREEGASFALQAAKPGAPYLGTHYEISSCLRQDSLGYSQI